MIYNGVPGTCVLHVFDSFDVIVTRECRHVVSTMLRRHKFLIYIMSDLVYIYRVFSTHSQTLLSLDTQATCICWMHIYMYLSDLTYMYIANACMRTLY